LPVALGMAFLAKVQLLLAATAYSWFACYAGVMVQISMYAFLLIVMNLYLTNYGQKKIQK
jgi:hypothetical protein